MHHSNFPDLHKHLHNHFENFDKHLNKYLDKQLKNAETHFDTFTINVDGKTVYRSGGSATHPPQPPQPPHSNSYHFHRSSPRRGCLAMGRPSRIVWFVIGGLTAAWWMKSKDKAEGYAVRHCSNHRIPQEAYPPPPPTQPLDQWQWHRWDWRQNQQARPLPPITPVSVPAPANSLVPVPVPPREQVQPAPVSAEDMPATLESKLAESWEEERQRLQQIKDQAAENLANLSETGLESMIASMESLKNKLSERRKKQEEEAKAQQALLESAKAKQYAEWKQKYEAEKIAAERANRLV